jgi:hypothetical protein
MLTDRIELAVSGIGVCLAINDCAFAGLVDGPAGSKAASAHRRRREGFGVAPERHIASKNILADRKKARRGWTRRRRREGDHKQTWQVLRREEALDRR